MYFSGPIFLVSQGRSFLLVLHDFQKVRDRYDGILNPRRSQRQLETSCKTNKNELIKESKKKPL